MKTLKLIGLLVLALICGVVAPAYADGKKKIILVAGTPSHGPGEHEFNAGVLLLKSCLDKIPGIDAIAYTNGWPKDPNAFAGADAIMLYMDGGDGHPAIQDNRLAQLREALKNGAGLACVHYGVEVPANKGGKEFLEWIGGYFEAWWSVNPTWEATFKTLPNHPITRGVKPFTIRDEWYYHMRFQPERVTPILSAVPPESTRNQPDDPHGGNKFVRDRKGMSEDMAWAYDRPDGGRGFGFTGAHYHKNWGDDNFRKLMLNAILWIAKMEVPADGVSSSVTPEQLEKNLDPKGQRRQSSARPPTQAKFKSAIVQSGTIPIDVDITGAQKLYLLVTDGGDGITADWADWLNPVLLRKDGTSVKLNEIKWKTASTGWGNIGVNMNAAGNPLKIGDKVIAEGIGTHAPSLIEFELPGEFVRFQARAGLDDGGTSQNAGSSVEFMVFTEPPPRILLKIASADSAANHPHGPAAAQESLKNFKVADGLAVSLFASEPMVRNPTDMDIDERGRVWITEGVNYRSSFQSWGILQPAGDRIMILEDTKGSGMADKETVFYQGPEINAALGICVLGNKAIVSCSPNVYVFTDTDGDGKADKKELLFSGISGVDHDHGVHAVVFGPDGRFYFNMGNYGHQLKDKSGKLVVDLAGNQVNANGRPYRGGMVLRCNPDGSDLEVLAHNFRNPYEVAVDSFGTMWQSDNDDDGNRGVRINYVMEYGNYGYSDEMTGAGWSEKRTNLEKDIPHRHWHQNDPGVVPNLLLTGAGAPTGIAVYEGTLLPGIFRNQIIHADAGPRIVRAYPVQSDGAGYQATTVDLLSTGDSWFRPVDVCAAPDGSVYVADWNDAGVGGHNMADRNPDTMTGRVYRLAPPGVKATAPKLDLKSAAGCIQALQSPNLSTRYLAWTALNEMQSKAEKELLKLWQDGNDPRMRARALFLLARIHGSESKYVQLALKDKNADLRITGLRIARQLKMDVIPLIKQLVKDPSPSVRRECAIALHHNSSPDAPGLWTALARQHDGKDRWYLEALGIGADRQEDKFFSAWLAAVGSDWNTPAGRDIIWRSRSAKSPELLVKIIEDKATTEETRARYIRALDFIKGPEKDAALIEMLTFSQSK